MKQRVADYIADFLAGHGITDIFTVVGGGAMHLNNAFGLHRHLKCIYNHHEQASAMAAEAYARINGRLAAVCVTTGPGGTNAMTGVLGGYLDNIPMLVISGQVRYSTTVESTGLNLRQLGEQEYTIVNSVQSMTKYAVMVKDPTDIRYHLEKGIYLANNGRKGPCWLDIPLDVQGAVIETDDLEGYIPEAGIHLSNAVVSMILNELKKAERPVILAGSALRLSGALDAFYELANKLNIPVICPTSVADLMHTGHSLYFGNFGVFGGRPGNFIVQNADLLLSLGCRLSFKQTGFNFSEFAKNAKKIVVDIDGEELKKGTVKIDVPVLADVADVIVRLNAKLTKSLPVRERWISYCNYLKQKFPIVQKKHTESTKVNPYYFSSILKEMLPNDAVVVVGNSCACVSVLQSGVDKCGQRLFGNVNCGSMGYDLPAALGAAAAQKGSVICVTGDGSIQMNLQELQTIVHNKLPVKIVIFNNGGYQAIVQTQTNFFGGFLSGCTPQSGVSFPSFEKISYAYGIPYFCIHDHGELAEGISWLLSNENYAICEVMQDTSQPIEPKVLSKRLPDGTMYSPPIDDLAPFIDKKEYDECSYRIWEAENARL